MLSPEFRDTLLNLNPNDNQGIRFLLADVYHYIGDEKSAEKYYKKYGEPEGAYNYALLLYSTGQKSRAIRLLRNSIKAAPLVAIMLRAYLKMFNFWQEKGVFGLGKNPPLFLHRNAVIGAWNENIDRAKNYADYLQLKSAHDFCSLYGPLWLRQNDSYTLLLEAMNATAGNNRR